MRVNEEFYCCEILHYGKEGGCLSDGGKFGLIDRGRVWEPEPVRHQLYSILKDEDASPNTLVNLAAIRVDIEVCWVLATLRVREAGGVEYKVAFRTENVAFIGFYMKILKATVPRYVVPVSEMTD